MGPADSQELAAFASLGAPQSLLRFYREPPRLKRTVNKTKEGQLSNTDTVRAIYEAFGRGDVSTILDKLDDAVEWETQAPVPGVPWLQSRRGKANIVGFFETLAPLTITRFEPHTVFDGGDKVFVLITFEATHRGKAYSFPNNGHLWQFNGAGKVVKYDHVTDTAQMLRMAKGE